ncbi:MAG: HRDC domain-containing protein [Spirochaetota bacterium]
MQINSKYLLIDNKKSFELALISLKNSKYLAVDTESSGYYTYYSRVCLIQCTAFGKNYIFDPLSSIQIERLQELFSNDSIVKIFHSAIDDVKVMKRDFGFTFANLVDTMYSSKLLGMEHNSLNYLIEHYHGIKLSKAMQKSNWEHRPLYPNQLKYAALDTAYLEETWKLMEEKLAERALTEEAYSEFARIQEEPAADKEGSGEIAWYKFQNIAKYTPEARRNIYDILVFREEKAKRMNKSPFRILNYDAIQKIVLQRPSLQELIGKHGKNDGTTIYEIIQNPSGPPIEKVEYPRADDGLSKDEEVIYKRFKKLREELIRKRKIDHSMLPSNKHLVAILKKQPQDLQELQAMNLMSDWKVQNYGPLFLHALQNEPYTELLKQFVVIQNAKKKKKLGFNPHFVERKLSKNFAKPDLPTELQEYKISSVILAFTLEEGKPSFIVTQRSKDLRNHPGQISFPGGGMDEEDKNLLDTALREWEEETGEKKESLKILGRFDATVSGTGYHITPIVASYRSMQGFQANPKEVDEIFTISYDDFQKYPFYAIKLEELKATHKKEEIFYLDHPKGLLWGATCEMLVKFLRKYAGFSRAPEYTQFNRKEAPFFQPKQESSDDV